MNANILVFTSNSVFDKSSGGLSPATIIVDAKTGKIVDIKRTRSTRSDFPDVANDKWIDVGDKCILPGLVE